MKELECLKCKRKFTGSNRAIYCPECRVLRKREIDSAYREKKSPGASTRNKRTDLTGQIFGELYVVKFSHTDAQTRAPMWHCRCSCGTEKDIPGYALMHGTYKSCGCKRIENRDKGAQDHMVQDRIAGTRKSALKAKLHVGNSSGVKGVRFVASRGKWNAYIGFQNKNINLGYYDSMSKAVEARREAEAKYYKPILEEQEE